MDNHHTNVRSREADAGAAPTTSVTSGTKLTLVPLCVGYGFRFVNGQRVDFRQSLLAIRPCTLYAHTVRHPMRSISQVSAERAAPSAVRAAKKHGGRRLKISPTFASPRSRERTRWRDGPIPRRPATCRLSTV